MRTYRTQRGPFAERPYYKDDEIEHLCLDELRKVELLPTDPEPIRIERFIEKRFRVNPVYENLPDGVLGFTKFGARGVEEIVVARGLTEEGTKTAERRLNTTLAHEAGHGLLHAHLFALGMDGASLFDGTVDPRAPKILCRDETVAGGQLQRASYDGRWWEYQANRTIGALLLPKPLVPKCLEAFLVRQGAFGMLHLDEEREEEAEQTLADIFDVNPVVVRLRIRELYRRSNIAQLEF